MMRSVPPDASEATPPDDRDAVLRALFQASPDGLLIVDGEGRIAMANALAAQMLGYPADELQGLAVDALVPDAVRPHHAQYRAGFAAAPRTRPMGGELELTARRRDGSEFQVEIALAPLQSHGLPYVMAAIRNVGEYPRVKRSLKRARLAECVAQLGRLAVDAREPQAVLEHAPAAAAEALDCEMAVLYLLEPGGHTLRVAAGVGLLASEQIGARVSNRVDSPAGFVLAQRAPVVVSRYADETRFAVPREYLDAGLVCALAVPLSDRGRIVGALSVRSRHAHRVGDDEVQFLTSLASLVATVQQRNAGEEALRHSQRLEAVGQLTGGIAHDFNNLLTVISGNLQVLADWPALDGDAGAQQVLAAAGRAARRGADLTAKLLAFSRRQVLQPRPIDAARMLGAFAELLRRTLDARVRIEVAADADCPACLADAAQLESALLNLAINARDAMPAGGTLAFRARRCARDETPEVAALGWASDGVAWSVADSGVGMSEAVRARAFEPFFTTKEAGRGTGLGLATVHGFAHQSRGAVALESRAGQGTIVTLYLPGAAEAPIAAPRAPRAAAVVPAGLRVLLVEDEPEVLALVQTFLAGWGAEVTAGADAEAALAALRRSDAGFDLLLSDVVLGPGLRGTELALRARELRPGLPVLLVSGYAHDAPPADAPLLRKPFTREQLAEAIVRVIAR